MAKQNSDKSGKSKKNNKGGKMGAFLAGAAVATAAGGYFLFGSKKGPERRQKIESWTLKAKAEVLGKLEKAKDISKEKYEKIVDQVTEKYAKSKDVSRDKADKLNRELKRHWKQIEKEAEGAKGKAEKRTNTARRKLARKIAPKQSSTEK